MRLAVRVDWLCRRLRPCREVAGGPLHHLLRRASGLTANHSGSAGRGLGRGRDREGSSCRVALGPACSTLPTVLRSPPQTVPVMVFWRVSTRDGRRVAAEDGECSWMDFDPGPQTLVRARKGESIMAHIDCTGSTLYEPRPGLKELDSAPTCRSPRAFVTSTGHFDRSRRGRLRCGRSLGGASSGCAHTSCCAWRPTAPSAYTPLWRELLCWAVSSPPGRHPSACSWFASSSIPSWSRWPLSVR